MSRAGMRRTTFRDNTHREKIGLALGPRCDVVSNQKASYRQRMMPLREY